MMRMLRIIAAAPAAIAPPCEFVPKQHASFEPTTFLTTIDLTYYVLYLMSAVGIIRDLNGVPGGIRESNRLKEA